MLTRLPPQIPTKTLQRPTLHRSRNLLRKYQIIPWTPKLTRFPLRLPPHRKLSMTTQKNKCSLIGMRKRKFLIPSRKALPYFRRKILILPTGHFPKKLRRPICIRRYPTPMYTPGSICSMNYTAMTSKSLFS